MLVEAAANNAAWCDAVCRTHGIDGVFGPGAWTAPARTPPYYPDAVTLTPDVAARDVLDAVDPGPGASVKDSFATLDLRPAGFHVLFEAQWIHRPAPAPRAVADGVTWEAVRDAATLGVWERANVGGQAPGVFQPSLLARPGVAVLAGRRDDGAIAYGFVLNVSGAVAGVSNLFARDGDADAAWTGALSMAAELFPGRPLVGYERDVSPAVRHGFVPIGPLRVWLKS